LVAAILGIMPTGINVAIWHSLWALEHEKAWLADGSTRAQALAKGRFDLLVGYGVSALLAVIFVALGAELLKPRGLVPQGIDVALTLSEIYTEVLGSWMLPLFLLAAFLALFSTAYSVMDGFPRTFAMLLRELLPEQRWVAGQGTYWGFMAAIFLVAIAANTLFPNPVTLVQWVGAVSLAVAPLLYGLNWYCVNRLIEDPTLRPPPYLAIWGGLGVLAMLGAVVAVFWIRAA
jgi:Mn2+/Fe2+ NRAMP family transporter